MKMTTDFTITFSSKMLARQCFTSLEHTFLDDGLHSLYVIYYCMYLNFEAFKGIEKIEKVAIFLVLPNSMGILNQKNLWPKLIYLFEHLYHCSGTPYCCYHGTDFQYPNMQNYISQVLIIKTQTFF